MMIDAAGNQDVICSRCGAANEAGLPACLLCGTPLVSSGVRVAGPPPAMPVGPAPPYGYAPPYAYPPPAPPTSSRGPRSGALLGVGVALLLGLCLLTLVGGGAFAVVNSGRLFAPPSPTPLNPATLIDEATAAGGRLKTLHYLMTGAFPDPQSGSSVPAHITIEGDVALPDSFTMHSAEYGDRVVIGPDIYNRSSQNPAWQHHQATSTDSADVLGNPTALLGFLKYYDPGSVELQDDVVSGTQHLHQVRLEIDTSRLAQGEGPNSAGAALDGTTVQGMVRIDATTHLVDRLTLVIVTPRNGSATITLQLSRYDAPVKITAPGDQGQ